MNHAIKEIESYFGILNERLQPITQNKILSTALEQTYGKINNVLARLLSKIFDTAFTISQNIVSLAIAPIIIYYFLVDGNLIVNRLLLLLPIRGRSIANKIMEDIDKILGKYIISQFILCIMVGGFTFFILLLYKVEFPIMLSILNAAFNIIPYFGPIFGAIPAIIMAALKSSHTAIWVCIWLYLVQQIEGNLISPKITGDSVSMHPLLIIILLLIGGELGGFIGMVLAVPIGVILKVIYEDMNHYIF